MTIDSETGKFLRLSYNKNNQGLLNFDFEIQNVNFNVRVAHNYFNVFRVFIFYSKKDAEENPESYANTYTHKAPKNTPISLASINNDLEGPLKPESDDHELLFFYDLWIDEEDFEDNFNIIDRNPIGDFYEEVLAKDAINLDKLKQKSNLVYFKSLRKKKNFEELIQQNLAVFNCLVGKKKSSIAQIVHDYNYCMSRYRNKEHSDFALIRENLYS